MYNVFSHPAQPALISHDHTLTKEESDAAKSKYVNHAWFKCIVHLISVLVWTEL